MPHNYIFDEILIYIIIILFEITPLHNHIYFNSRSTLN